MAYSYLLKLYKILEYEKSELSKAVEHAGPKSVEDRKLQGKLSVINEFHQYLLETYDQKLPRRMQRVIK